ncbi:putative phage abortive infection protein [Priestia aryabhattai]|uniref:putative phage abortive infection protein n=1 Tax=Priestia aryabhattai TaxID=412384 RepID=UPI003983D008
MNEEDKGSKEEISSWKKKENWIIAIGIIAIAAAIATPFIILHEVGGHFTYKQFDKLGVVGDFFGGTTVGLFTLASIIFVIAAIVMQKKELELQRKELAQTREEFKTGNTTAKVQQIDNAFFNMLSLHHQIVNGIKMNKGSKVYIGREAILTLRNIYEDQIGWKLYSSENPSEGLLSWLEGHRVKKEYLENLFGSFDTINQENLDEVYREFHDAYGNDIGHYMRNNYRIVKFIVNNVANDEFEQEKIRKETGREPIIGDKRYYFGMLRAQWSNAEFELILINSLYKENHKFKDLILKYDVLDIKEATSDQQAFKLKSSMSKFKAYRSLIEK